MTDPLKGRPDPYLGPPEPPEPDPIAPSTFAERYGVTLDVVEGPALRTEDDGWQHNAYTLRLSYVAEGQPHRILTPWRQGTGIIGSPELADVLLDLARTARDADSTWDDFAADYALDADSRRAYAMWERSVALGQAVTQWAGHADGMSADLARVEEV